MNSTIADIPDIVAHAFNVAFVTAFGRTRRSLARTTSARPLTIRQRSVLTFIEFYSRERGYAPSHREIGDRLGITSTNGVSDHLRALERKGYITRDRHVSRGLRVIRAAE